MAEGNQVAGCYGSGRERSREPARLRRQLILPRHCPPWTQPSNGPVHFSVRAGSRHPPPAPDSTVFVVGDVHGHLEHLDGLLDLSGPSRPGARSRAPCELVMVGDFVDRGPASIATLRRLIGLEHLLAFLSMCCAATTISYLIDFLLAEQPDPEALEAWCGNGGLTTLAELGHPHDEVARPRSGGPRRPGARRGGTRGAGGAAPARAVPVVRRLCLRPCRDQPGAAVGREQGRRELLCCASRS